MPDVAVSNSTAANASLGNEDLLYYPIELDPTDLVPGTNLLAVSVHSSGADGDDDVAFERLPHGET